MTAERCLFAIEKIVILAEAPISMSALEALDRYIQQHEVTLQSISRQKLSRKPVPVHNELGASQSFTNNSQFDISVGNSCRPSIATELQNLIMRLQHIQQSRLSQLQQANALFLHEMNIEDQFNMDVKTEQECNNELAEDEFEAFLLGESKEDTEVPKPAEEVPSSHPTLFTRTNRPKPTNVSTRPEAKNKDGADEQKRTTDAKVEQEELSVSFTDDVIMQLQRSRQERTQRLRNIATSIQCTTAQTTQYPLSTFKMDVLDISKIPSARDGSHNSQYQHADGRPSFQMTGSELGSLNTTHEAPITLQSILEDEEFAVPSLGSEKPTAPSIPSRVTAENDRNSHEADQYIVAHQTPSLLKEPVSGNASKYLTNNRSRKALEQQLVERSKENLSLTSHSRSSNNNINTGKSRLSKVPDPPIPPRSPRSSAINPPNVHTDQDNVHGIGYGSRYEHTIQNNSEVETWEESSVGSADGSVRSLDQHFLTSTRYHSEIHYDNTNHHNHSNIFEYADALESPLRKVPLSRTNNSTENAAYPHATTTHNTRHVVFAENTDVPKIQRAVEVESRVSRYYKQRMHRLEFGTDLGSEESADYNSNRNTAYAATVGMHNPPVYTDIHSPERNSHKSDHNFESPLPKTPTFPPIFS